MIGDAAWLGTDEECSDEGPLSACRPRESERANGEDAEDAVESAEDSARDGGVVLSWSCAEASVSEPCRKAMTRWTSASSSEAAEDESVDPAERPRDVSAGELAAEPAADEAAEPE